jgi:glycosyltransferase involved in cell wall biosynthesis
MNGAANTRRVLQVHTRYRLAGGEDAVVDAERRLLTEAGIQLRQVIFDNAELRDGESIAGDARLAASAVWSRAAERRVRDALASSRAQVVHVHNTFTAASPSVYAAAARAAVPVVQTLHNYRLVCPAATAFRAGHPCTDCLGRVVPWPGVLHACVRGSHRQSLVAAASSTFHHFRGTYRHDVARYIALSNFQRNLMIPGGLPGNNVVVIPNFLEPDPGSGGADRSGILYVGRLSVEKGVEPMLAAARLAPDHLTVVGDGPLRHEVEVAMQGGGIRYVGPLLRESILDQVGRSIAVVMPSICFEGMPMVLLEAFATGTPVIASRIGSLAELVEDGVTGLLVNAGDAAQLAAAMRWAVEHPDEMRSMGANARKEYEARYRGPTHLAALMDVYESVIDEARRVEKHPA